MKTTKLLIDWINDLDGLSVQHAIEYLERFDKNLVLECFQHEDRYTEAYFVNPIVKDNA